MTGNFTQMVTLLAALGVAGQACAYSEEDWRAYSRTRVARVDTLTASVTPAGPMAIVGSELVYLRQGSDELVYLDTATGELTRTAPLHSGWNLRVCALAGHGDGLYLLSATTRKIYVHSRECAPSEEDIILDLQTLRLAGKPSMRSFAYDGEYVYMALEAGFGTRITRIDPVRRTSEMFADADGTRMLLSCDGQSVWFVSHPSEPRGAPTLAVYDRTKENATWSAQRKLYMELPCGPAAAFVASGSKVWVLPADGDGFTVVGIR